MAKKTFLITSAHTKETCLQALDELAASKSKELLDNAWFACMAGDHKGWTTVQASNEAEAKGMLPSSIKGRAEVKEVSKFTRDQIRSFHK